jgi:hypothetical protein
MPLKSITVVRAKSTRSRGVPTTRSSIPRALSNNDTVTPWILQTYSVGAITVAGAIVLGSFQIALNDLPLNSSMLALFEEYKIGPVDFHFLPVFTQVATTVAGTNIPGNIATVVDLDDATAPTSLSVLYGYPSFQSRQCCKDFRIQFEPKMALATYTGSFAAFGYAPKAAEWVNTASNNAIFYGLKYAVYDNNFSAATTIYNVECTFNIRFRRFK